VQRKIGRLLLRVLIFRPDLKDEGEALEKGNSEVIPRVRIPVKHIHKVIEEAAFRNKRLSLLRYQLLSTTKAKCEKIY